MAANRRPRPCRIWRTGTGQQRRGPHYRYDAAERALHAVLEFHRRTWLRQAEGVLGGVRRADRDADSLAHDADLVAEPDASRPGRSGTYAGADHPSRDGLKPWEPTGGGWCAAGSRA